MAVIWISAFVAVRRLTLCEDLVNSPCGDLLFTGYLNPPGKNRRCEAIVNIWCPAILTL